MVRLQIEIEKDLKDLTKQRCARKRVTITKLTKIFFQRYNNGKLIPKFYKQCALLLRILRNEFPEEFEEVLRLAGVTEQDLYYMEKSARRDILIYCESL